MYVVPREHLTKEESPAFFQAVLSVCWYARLSVSQNIEFHEVFVSSIVKRGFYAYIHVDSEESILKVAWYMVLIRRICMDKKALTDM